MRKASDLDRLSEPGRRLFQTVQKEWGVNIEPYVSILSDFCQSFDEVRDLRAKLGAEGYLSVDRFGQTKPNPLSQLLREAPARMIASARALKLDVDSVRLDEKEAENKLFARKKR